MDNKEKIISRIAAGGDDGKAASGELAVMYLDMIPDVVSEFLGQGLDEDDLIGIGEEALFLAACSYDSWKSQDFVVFATEEIKNAVKTALSEEAGEQEAAGSVISQMSIVKTTEQELKDDLGRVPTDEELAKKLDMTADQVSTIRAYLDEVIRNTAEKEKSNAEVLEEGANDQDSE